MKSSATKQMNACLRMRDSVIWIATPFDTLLLIYCTAQTESRGWNACGESRGERAPLTDVGVVGILARSSTHEPNCTTNVHARSHPISCRSITSRVLLSAAAGRPE